MVDRLGVFYSSYTDFRCAFSCFSHSDKYGAQHHVFLILANMEPNLANIPLYVWRLSLYFGKALAETNVFNIFDQLVVNVRIRSLWSSKGNQQSGLLLAEKRVNFYRQCRKSGENLHLGSGGLGGVIFFVNIMERIAQKLRRSILFHFGRVACRCHFGTTRTFHDFFGSEIHCLQCISLTTQIINFKFCLKCFLFIK